MSIFGNKIAHGCLHTQGAVPAARSGVELAPWYDKYMHYIRIGLLKAQGIYSQGRNVDLAMLSVAVQADPLWRATLESISPWPREWWTVAATKDHEQHRPPDLLTPQEMRQAGQVLTENKPHPLAATATAAKEPEWEWVTLNKIRTAYGIEFSLCDTSPLVVKTFAKRSS